MTIASWLLVVAPGEAGAVREALDARPGIERRGDARGRLVVVSESPSEAGALEAVHALLTAVPGVRDASLVAALEDEGEGR